MDEGMKIGEVAELTGLSIRTLRHYDDLGVISPSGHTPGGFRLYGEADLERILLIRRMKPLGFTLEEIRDFLGHVDELEAGQLHAGKVVDNYREDARARLDSLRLKVSYAEEFLALIDRVQTSPH
ncbi:MerR family transcriptional regulator [Corynebacterium alimapuense]|uniref:MerR family transcriptional regulator n=2 Tax=Corynebacterium alimapuense TaxID=1576874 RepID=A0A3M8K6H5_9CORY|nr:MerR family transcriptional regulator [Corynebacterium alimapuense]